MRIKRVVRAVAVTLAGVLAVTLNPAAAHATFGDGWYSMVNQKDGNIFLDVYPAVGSAVIVSNFRSSGAGQPLGRMEWRQVPQSDGTVIFRNAGTSNQFALSIEGNGKSNNTRVLAWWYQPTNKFQKWVVDASWTGGIKRWRNVGASENNVDKCLAVRGAADGVAPGDQVIIWDCGSGEDQQWYYYDS